MADELTDESGVAMRERELPAVSKGKMNLEGSDYVLLLSYLFPPVGGAGVQRNLKYTKYLPQFNWTPIVLTVKEIKYYTTDPVLLNEVPSSAVIVRSGSLDPLRITAIFSKLYRKLPRARKDTIHAQMGDGSQLVRFYRAIRNFATFPDAQMGWIPFAYFRGLNLIRRYPVRAIVGSIGPLSSALLARMLSRRTGVPYVLDFRDGWLDDPYFRTVTPLHRRAHELFERRALQDAAAIVVYDEWLQDALKVRYPNLANRIHVLPNGYDSEDAENISPVRVGNDSVCRIVYAGTLYAHHAGNLKMLLAGLQRLPGDLRESLEVDFVGQAFEGARTMVEKAGLERTVHLKGYQSHAQALSYLCGANASLLFIRKGDVSSITGKVFEYLMCGRPILACIEPQGACARLLRKAGYGDWISAPDDVDGFARNISALASAGWRPPSTASAEQFSRREITRRLGAILAGLSRNQLA